MGQWRIEGAYRIELWAGIGGEGVANLDNLGALGHYNGCNVNQFNVKVEALPS